MVQTWGSSPFQIGSKMIINDKGKFLGSVSGGCVETSVITECIELIKNKNSFKKINFKVWTVLLITSGPRVAFYYSLQTTYKSTRYRRN